MCNQYKSTGRCCGEVTVCMRRIVRKLVFRSDLCMSHFIKFSVTSAAKVYVTTRSQCIETTVRRNNGGVLLEKHRASHGNIVPDRQTIALVAPSGKIYPSNRTKLYIPDRNFSVVVPSRRACLAQDPRNRKNTSPLFPFPPEQDFRFTETSSRNHRDTRYGSSLCLVLLLYFSDRNFASTNDPGAKNTS